MRIASVEFDESDLNLSALNIMVSLCNWMALTNRYTKIGVPVC